jgi:hypothetical protein
MSVAPGTKPASQWCPTGLTRTQKRRVQRLRALEINEQITKKRSEWLNRNRKPMMHPKKIWKKKCIATDVKVADHNLIPKYATFKKPENYGQHLKPLFIRGHIDGKPMGRMLVDGGASGNIMPFSVFSKLNRKESELMKTNKRLSGFSGELSEAKGVISMKLTVGSKTVETAFFVVDIRGRYDILLGRDWIHANCCIPSTLHQCLIQWVDDDVEVIEADNFPCIALTEVSVDSQHGEMRCLTGRDLSVYDYINICRDGFVPIKAQPANIARFNDLSI